jgi:hypothetical protein
LKHLVFVLAMTLILGIAHSVHPQRKVPCKHRATFSHGWPVSGKGLQ